MIQLIVDEVLSILCHILNHSLTNTVFPDTWKGAQIIPLPSSFILLRLSSYFRTFLYIKSLRTSRPPTNNYLSNEEPASQSLSIGLPYWPQHGKRAG